MNPLLGQVSYHPQNDKQVLKIPLGYRAAFLRSASDAPLYEVADRFAERCLFAVNFVTRFRRLPARRVSGGRTTGVCLAMLSFLAGATSALSAPLTSIAEARALAKWSPVETHPVRLAGIVTHFDALRSLLVLQKETESIALNLHGKQIDVSVGQHVRLEADDSWPTVVDVPGFPAWPDQSDALSSFESIPAIPKKYFISRFRGWVYPPATGQYHFAIASDDSADLLLGTTDDPRTRRVIAQVRGYTRERDWLRVPMQRSKAIFLEAGQAYYIETVHHQAAGVTHLSVAWEGPDIALSIIPGKWLSPWKVVPASQRAIGSKLNRPAQPTGAVLREAWTDVTVDDPGFLSHPRRLEGTLSVSEPKIETLPAEPMPEPMPLRIGQPLSAREDFRWDRVEGIVTFVSLRDEQLQLEISDGGNKAAVTIPQWKTPLPTTLRGRRVRISGVGESILEKEKRVLGRLWLPSPDAMTVLPDTLQVDFARRTSIAELTYGDPESFRDLAVKVVGRVFRQDGNKMTLRNSGTFRAFTSTNGAQWQPLGSPIEMEMTPNVYLGLVVNSRSPDAKSRAVFSDVTGLATTATLVDVGNPKGGGAINRQADRYEIMGVGSDIWDTPDQFTFVHAPHQGDGAVVTRLESFAPADPGARAGIMIRESLASDSQFVDVVRTADEGFEVVSLQWRHKAEGHSQRSVNTPVLQLGSPLWLKLERHTDSIEVTANAGMRFDPGESVEVAGYATIEGGRVAMVDGAVRRQVPDVVVTASNGAWRPLVELSRLVGEDDKWNGYDFFRIRGVVTFCGDVAGRHYWSVQDSSGAMLLQPRDPSKIFRPAPGTFVEICSNPGWLPPTNTLFADNLFVQGTAGFPKPVRHPAEYLMPKRGEATWIELEGIARSVPRDGMLTVKTSGEEFTVAISGAKATQLRTFIDADVRIRGVITYPNERERLLLVPSLEHLEIVKAARTDPFAQSAEPTNALSPETLLNQSRHRTKITGTVTWSDKNVVFVQDGGGAARAELETPTAAVLVGTAVELVGFPDVGDEGGVVLRNAILRSKGAGSAVVPALVDSRDLVESRSTFLLVRVRAKLAKQVSTAQGDTLELEADQRVFRAVFSGGHGAGPVFPVGSLLELTGVCVNETGLFQWVRASSGSSSILPIKLLLRSPADVAVLQIPRWWAVKRTLIVTGVIGAIFVVASLWIHALRKRVKLRTAELAATMEQLEREVRMSATLAERDRLAGEIHDTVEQGLNGLVFQLDTTADLKSCPPDVRSGLVLARNMAAFSKAEVEHAVWELQSPLLEDSELPVALEKIVNQIVPETLQATVKVNGSPRRLPSAVEHHLLRIAQEATNNAVKHSGAKHVEVALSYETHAIGLCINDDGCGFEPKHGRSARLGHFGLTSMRSRAIKISGQFSLVSAPGHGTQIHVHVRVPVENV